MNRFKILWVGFLTALFLGNMAFSDDARILVQSTTSTQNSGLYDYLLPHFEKETGFRVDVVAVGTGQAIKNAKNGDADVLFVHAMQSELEFVEQGYGIDRYDIMYNDFVFIGPKEDPANIANSKTVSEALASLNESAQIFVSRGDDSGTHKKELRLWGAAGLSPDDFSADWYREIGSGMGATIRMAVETNSYTLTDRATWIAFNNKADHRILVSGQNELFNQYGIIAVNPSKHPHVNSVGGDAFIKWLRSDHGQNLIAKYKVHGQQLFFPNAYKTVAK